MSENDKLGECPECGTNLVAYQSISVINPVLYCPECIKKPATSAVKMVVALRAENNELKNKVRKLEEELSTHRKETLLTTGIEGSTYGPIILCPDCGRAMVPNMDCMHCAYFRIDELNEK